MFNIIKKTVSLLSKEVDELELKKVRFFLESEVKSDSFLHELENCINKIEDSNKKKINELIIKCILLGLGRNRTLEILAEYNVKRGMYEQLRKDVDLVDSELRIENERIITSFKWAYKTRLRRDMEIEKIDWDLLRDEYIKGESVVQLAKKYKITNYHITNKLEEEGVYDETRSTLTQRDIANDNYIKIDNEYITKLVESNPLTDKESLWNMAKNKYPWLLRRQMYEKMDELNLTRTADEVNEIRRIKSTGESNTSYMIKLNGYKAVKEVFGSTERLVKKYMTNSLGSYNKIADEINRKITFEHEITPKQLSKIITGNPNYVRNKSLGQQQLYKFIKNTFKDLEVIEEYAYDKASQKKIDVYIPSLKIGFEFNGDYWHSDVVINYNYGKTAHDFHKDRADILSSLDIKLLFVWENDWNFNYKEIEKAIINKDWNSKILNKYDNAVKRSSSFNSPDKLPSLLRNQIMRFLKEKKINYTKSNNSSLIEIKEHSIIINVPNYNALSNKKESLNLQKYYKKQNVELLTFLPWRNICKIKEFLSYRLKLKNIMRIAARKCKVESNTGITKTQREFFENNHLLGYGNGIKYVDKTITLTHNGELMIAALFTRKPNSSTVELKRLVSSYGFAVQGGASRLLKEYIRQTPDVEEIFTFSDCDLGFGTIYKTLGFEQTLRSKEQLTWFNEEEDMKINNVSLIQVGADRLLRNLPNYEPVGIGKNLPSNQEIVQMYGFIPIYDSGYKKWKLEVNQE